MASSQTKKCTGKRGCGKMLQLEKFSIKTSAPDGHRYICKECQKAYKEKRYADPVKRKRMLDHMKTPAAKAKRQKRDKARAATRRGKLERSVKAALKNFAVLKMDSARNRALFGCTIAEIRAHIESLFEDWMDWDNYGINTGEYDKIWQFDHIIPYKAFETYEELEKNQKIVCWHKNVQPMCAKKNAEKDADYTEEDKQALIRRYHVEAVMEEIISIVAQDA